MDLHSTERATQDVDFDAVLPEYRERWRSRDGRSWADVEPAYRVGWDVARAGGRGRGWREVEPDFRREWAKRYPDKPWDRFLDAAQEVWDELTAEPGPSPRAGDPRAHDESSGR